MLAMSGDQILMSDQAELGPTDPQMNTSQGVSPAQAVIDQFEKAKAEITQNPAGLPAWAPILAQMGPSLLQQCQNAITLSRELVKRWLAGYMFTGEADAEQKAEVISEYLANHNNFMSHARGIRLTKLEELGVKALPFPDELVAPLWDLDCAVDITLGNTNVVRIIENHLGNRMLRKLRPGDGSWPPVDPSNASAGSTDTSGTDWISSGPSSSEAWSLTRLSSACSFSQAQK